MDAVRQLAEMPTATQPARPTRSWKHQAANSGVRITMVPVRNPETPAVVWRSPLVCSRNPVPRNRPRISPCRRSAPVRARSLAWPGEDEHGGRDPNLQVRKEAAETPASDCLVTRNVDPQIAVAASCGQPSFAGLPDRRRGSRPGGGEKSQGIPWPVPGLRYRALVWQSP